jgi:hypothetical protein
VIDFLPVAFDRVLGVLGVPRDPPHGADHRSSIGAMIF